MINGHINAPHDKEFVFHDGTRVKNLLELVSKLEHSSDHEFHHFVNEHKNDFSNWIEHVLLDKNFADALRLIHSRNETVQSLKDKIADIAVGSAISKNSKFEDKTLHDEIMRETMHDVASRHDSTDDVTKHDSTKYDFTDSAIKHDIATKHDYSIKHEHNIEHTTSSSSHLHAGLMNTSMNSSINALDEVPPIVVHARHNERLDELTARRNWFKLFSKKNLSEKRLERIEYEEEDKLRPEMELRDELSVDGREDALWVVLYIVLVLLILTLLVYKLFL